MRVLARAYFGHDDKPPPLYNNRVAWNGLLKWSLSSASQPTSIVINQSPSSCFSLFKLPSIYLSSYFYFHDRILRAWIPVHEGRICTVGLSEPAVLTDLAGKIVFWYPVLLNPMFVITHHWVLVFLITHSTKIVQLAYQNEQENIIHKVNQSIPYFQKCVTFLLFEPRVTLILSLGANLCYLMFPSRSSILEHNSNVVAPKTFTLLA